LYLSKTIRGEPTIPTLPFLHKSFEALCTEEVDLHLREAKGVMTTATLKKRFRHLAAELEGIDLSKNYNTTSLKQRLQARYPDIRFAWQGNNRSKPQIVYFGDNHSLTQVISQCA
jgi:hypothetical protein